MFEHTVQGTDFNPSQLTILCRPTEKWKQKFILWEQNIQCGETDQLQTNIKQGIQS